MVRIACVQLAQQPGWSTDAPRGRSSKNSKEQIQFYNYNNKGKTRTTAYANKALANYNSIKTTTSLRANGSFLSLDRPTFYPLSTRHCGVLTGCPKFWDVIWAKWKSWFLNIFAICYLSCAVNFKTLHTTNVQSKQSKSKTDFVEWLKFLGFNQILIYSIALH